MCYVDKLHMNKTVSYFFIETIYMHNMGIYIYNYFTTNSIDLKQLTNTCI